MKIIKRNNWFINDNELVISLMRFYVSISIIYDNNLVFNVRVVNSDTEIKEMKFAFSTLEDAIVFTEEVVSKCFNFEDVERGYDSFNKNISKNLVKKR